MRIQVTVRTSCAPWSRTGDQSYRHCDLAFNDLGVYAEFTCFELVIASAAKCFEKAVDMNALVPIVDALFGTARLREPAATMMQRYDVPLSIENR